MIRGLLLDLSGVLYEGDEQIPGAAEAVSAAQQAGFAVRFVTNTSQKPRAQILAQLRAMGFTLEAQELFTAVDAALGWLAERELRPYCLVHDNIRGEFDDIDQHEPNAVVLADAVEGFTYSALNEAFRLCSEGAPLLAVGYNRYYRAGGQLWLDAGAFVRALEFAADTRAVIVGKPSADFFGQVLASIPCVPAQAMMVGDDVFGDVEGALQAGLAATLVRTGKYRAGDEDRISGSFLLADSVVVALQRLLADGEPV